MYRHHLVAVALVALAGLASTASTADAQGRGRGRDEHPENHGREVSQAEQQRRIHEEQQRQQDYQARLDEQIRAAQAQQAQIQAQHHAAQIAQQQRYLDALRRQQEQARVQRDLAHDAYITTPMRYRYRLNGAYHETNQYGADVLRNAINNGYSEGYQQGQADRADGLSSNYRRSFAYQDANYGYTGAYIPQSDYNYYFRQGFQRGYQDGFANASRYGRYANGTGTVLGNILNGILGLVTIH
jgi:hypothetical protein